MKTTGKSGDALGMEKDWMAESDLRTLIEAEKIKSDPDRLKGAMKKRAEMKKAMDAVKA